MTEPQTETSGDIIRRTYARAPRSGPEPRADRPPAPLEIINRTYARSAPTPDRHPRPPPTATDQVADDEVADDGRADATATPDDDLAQAPTAAGDDAARTSVPDMAKTDPTDAHDAATAAPALLRALAGPHRGAELALRPGRYVIGADERCDIVLGDNQVAAQHAILTLADGALAIEPDEGTVIIDGAAIAGRVAVAAWQPVGLGSTVFAFGPAGVPWPEIDLAGAAPAGGDAGAGEGAAAGDAAAAVEAAQDAPTATGTGAGGAHADASEGAPATGTTVVADLERRRRGRWRAGVAAAALALTTVAASVAVDLWYTGREAAVAPAADRPTARTEVEAIVDRLGLAGRLEVTAAGGSSADRIVVQGYVGTEEQRRELLQALQPLLGSVDVRVWSTDLLNSSIAQALAGMRVDLDIIDVTDGKIVLTGLLPASATEDTLKQALQRDVPGIASIDLQVVSPTAAGHWLRDQIGSLGIPDQSLTISQEGHRFVVDGRLPARLKGGWQDTVSSFGQRYGQELTLRDDVTFVAAAPQVDRTTTPAAFDFVLRAINVGPPAYITLDTNEKFLIGSRLSNGMILEDVKADGVVLRDGEVRHLVEVSAASGRVDRVRQLESD